jgi:4-hydroxy-tetrahydrodipicolinate synthase
MSINAKLPPGLYPVMLTPFDDDGAIDWSALDALIEWYLEAGSAGLFAVCLSSEMYMLTEEERLRLAAHVASRARDRAPVVASGTFGGPIERQAAFVRRMAQTGVDAVVAIPCQLASPDEGDEVLRDRLEQLMAMTEPVPLGLYECPSPYHRVLSCELIGWAARSGRFLYHKDTQADVEPVRAKLDAIRGTLLGLYDASTPTVLASLLAGASGVSPIGANYYADLYVWMCQHYADRAGEARELQRMLAVMEGVASSAYPVAAKWYLQQAGLPLSTRCRVSAAALTYHDRAMLQALRDTARQLREGLG